jgi:DNA-directed RNA polymerase specialized sigma subunit
MPKKSSHYINNKEFLNSLIEYREKVAQAEQNGEPTPIIPNYVGECFLMIARRLSTKPNFISYQFREDMISDGVENCVQYINNFNPEKSKNPFAYFTQIIYYAFLRRIQKEKKQLYVKYSSTRNITLMEMVQSEEDIPELVNQPLHNDYSQEYIDDFMTTFENNLEKRKKAKKKVGIENFIEETEN